MEGKEGKATSLHSEMPRKSDAQIPPAGIEPARPKGQWILNPQRLPIPPRRR